MTQTPKQAGYAAEYRRSLEDPEGFWLDAARAIDWSVAPPAPSTSRRPCYAGGSRTAG